MSNLYFQKEVTHIIYCEKRDEIFEILNQLFVSHGYTVNHADDIGVECINDKTNICFSQIKEDKNYTEAVLNITTNEGIVMYDIFMGEYSSELFDEHSESDVFLKEELLLLIYEVERLALSAYSV